MRKKLLNVSERMARNGYIQEKHIKLYAQAMQIGLAMLANIITTVIIGLVFGMGWHAIILLAAFAPLRSYAGGYHASGYIKCYLESCVMLSVILGVMRYCMFGHEQVLLMIFGVSFILVILLAPLPDANKPASEEELQQYRKKARVLLIVESLLGVGLLMFDIQYGYSILLAIVMSAMLLVLHCLQSKAVKKTGRERSSERVLHE